MRISPALSSRYQQDGGDKASFMQFAGDSGNPVEHSPLEPSGYSVRFQFHKLPVGNLGQPGVPAVGVVRRVVENVPLPGFPGDFSLSWIEI